MKIRSIEMMHNAYAGSAAASRYDSARSLPPETTAVWIDALKSSVPGQINSILDLGCGTGRFTSMLAEAFGCSIVGVEPSKAMLSIAHSRGEPNIEWKLGDAGSIPLLNESVDLVFMSQVFHHLAQPQQALEEIQRVLTPAGCLAIRNGTREYNKDLKWLEFFPEALQIENERTPAQAELQELVCREYFDTIYQRTIYQFFAESYDEYFAKISRRGLSALITISDDAFQTGLQRFQCWVQQQRPNQPVYEPVDFFVFQRKAVSDKPTC